MNPILNQIGTIFIPVSDIKKARNWYCDLLGFSEDGDILFGHLYVLQMTGTGVVLDSRIFSKDSIFKVPVFHFNTKDIQQSYAYIKGQNIELTTTIIHNQWFNFKDPDGNHLMICEC